MDPRPTGGRGRGSHRTRLAHHDHTQRPRLTTRLTTERKNMDPRLIELLACPVSKAPVYFSEALQLIVCPTSKLAYPIKDGIPAMLPEDAIKLEEGDPLLNAPAR
jgi:uncharacterized protein